MKKILLAHAKQILVVWILLMVFTFPVSTTKTTETISATKRSLLTATADGQVFQNQGFARLPQVFPIVKETTTTKSLLGSIQTTTYYQNQTKLVSNTQAFAAATQALTLLVALTAALVLLTII